MFLSQTPHYEKDLHSYSTQFPVRETLVTITHLSCLRCTKVKQGQDFALNARKIGTGVLVIDHAETDAMSH